MYPRTRTANGGTAPAGDSTALSFATIFDQHKKFLSRTLWTLGVPAADIDDLSQDVFVVVHRRLADFDGRAVRSWLYAIGVRVASEHRRRAYVRREIVTDVNASTFAVAASQLEDLERNRIRARLWHVLDGLEDVKRSAYILHEIEEMTLREVAESLGCPVQTAYFRVQAAKLKINRAFGVNEFD